VATVLVVEDDPASMKLALLLLRSAGHHVLQAADAESAIELARSERPALILMDIRLPSMDGLAATRHLKHDPLTGGIKIIAVTGSAMKGDAERALAAGCDAYLSKPISYDSFRLTIDKLLHPT
jgi:two-component system, cell cycle response regulator DivK